MSKQITLPIKVMTLLVFWACLVAPGLSQAKNGFDLSNSSVPPEELVSGGPPRDGIPSIDTPKFIPASKVTYLQDDDLVIGLAMDGYVRAYPQRILIWHEIVNDSIGAKHVAVTYCPLCGTAMVFDREIDGKVSSFGVSGLLYQSDVLMYDRESESLWSQLAMKAISGPLAGNKLSWLPSEHISWQAWREKYPDGQVLSTETGYQRDYGSNAYASYFASDKTMFPVPQTRRELPNREWIIGVVINGQAKAYPADALPANQVLNDTVGGKKISLRYDADNRYPQVMGAKGNVIPSVMSFWFAWQAFYPGTELWKPSS